MADDKDKIINLAKKLLALAEHGADGEKDNAKSMFDSLMLKHNLTLNDIVDNHRSLRLVMNVNKDVHQMFINLVASIVGKDFKAYQCNKKTYHRVEMSDNEFYEFNEKWNIYKKSLKKEINKLKLQHKKELIILQNAFIDKHNLYSERNGGKKIDDLTAEELEEIKDMIRMQDKMEDINIYKKLTK